MIDYRNISLEELAIIENLSLSTEKKCFQSGLFNLGVFIDYWKDHGTFRGIENAGYHLDILLSNLCNKYALLPLMVKQGLPRETKLTDFIGTFDQVKKIMICQQIAISTSNFAPVTKSNIASKVQQVKNGAGILSVLYDEDYNFFKSGAGIQICSYLVKIKNRISALILSLTDASDGVQNARSRMLNLYLETEKGSELFDPAEAIDHRKKIKIFKLINLLVNSDLIFNANERALFQLLYEEPDTEDNNISSNTCPPIQTASVLNKLREDLFSYFSCISFLHAGDLSDYELQFSGDYIVIDANFVRTINERENVNFSRELYEKTLSFFLKSSHRLLTVSQSVKPIPRKSKEKSELVTSYIIRREIVAAFKFEEFVAHIRAIVEAETNNIEFLDFEEVLNRFLDMNQKITVQRIKEVCSIIVFNTFKRVVDDKGRLIIGIHGQECPENYRSVPEPEQQSRAPMIETVTQPQQLCLIEDIVKVLEQADMPASIDFIVSKLNEQFPDLANDFLSVRAMILANKELFFHIGYTGSYGLRAWQKANRNFKTEGVRTLVVNYLKLFDEPVPMDNALNHILQYRKITRDDLLSYADSKHAKIFINGDLVGLNNKKHLNIAGIVKSFDSRKKIILSQQIALLIRKFNEKFKNKIGNTIECRIYKLGIIDLLAENRPHLLGIYGKPLMPNAQLSKLKKKISTIVFKLQDSESSFIGINAEVLGIPGEVISPADNKIKLFKFIEVLADGDLIFNHDERNMFIYLFSTKNEIVQDDINSDQNGDIEVKKELEQKIIFYLRCFAFLNTDHLLDYCFDNNEDLVVVNNDFVASMNEREEVQFTLPFYSMLSTEVLRSTHVLIGKEKTAIRRLSIKNNVSLKAEYFVRQNLIVVYSFSAFIKYIEKLIYRKKRIIHRINFEDCLKKFLNPEHSEKLLRIKAVCQRIIQDEFNLLVDQNGILLIRDVRQNTSGVRKTLAEYLREVLMNFGKVTSLDEIVAALKNNYTMLKISEKSVRATLITHKQEFFTVGKSGTYGLKIWEEGKANVKGGTIRDMVKEYLNQSSLPVKDRELFQYVAQYRDTTFKNMKNNLMLDRGRTFVFFNGGFVGLKDKKYSVST